MKRTTTPVKSEAEEARDVVNELISQEGIDLRLPALKVSPDYKVTGKTEVGWEDGFYGKVNFVPWSTFDQIVHDTVDRINHLSPLQHMVTKLKLASLRFDISGQYRLEKLHNDAPPISGQFSALEDISANLGSAEELFTDETSTMGVNNNVFVAALSLVRNLEGNGTLFFRTHSFSSELVKNSYPAIVCLRRPTTVTPDQALVRFSDPQVRKVQPICTFEGKGPGLDFLGAGNKAEVSEGKTSFTQTMEKSKLSVATSTNGADISTVDNVGKDCVASTINGRVSDKTPETAKEVSKFMNTLFPEGYTSVDFRMGSLRKQQRVIAQTLAQGLVSESGCCFLYNYLSGIAFEIQGIVV